MKVLIIDDDGDLLAVLQEALQAEGWTVHTCKRVHEGRSALDQRQFDVVVTDLALEETGGLAFCEELSLRYPHVPVIVLTGHSEASSAAFKLGVRRVLLKPIDPGELCSALREVAGGTS